MSEKKDWREDPEWVLVQWSTNYWTKQPGDVPSAQAELCGNGAWASLFSADRGIVATWFRAIPLSVEEKDSLRSVIG